MNSILYSDSEWFHGASLAALAAAVLIMTLMQKRLLMFCLLFMVISTLPITFLENRAGARLYIPLVSYSLFAATVLVKSGQVLGRWMGLQRSARRYLIAALALIAIGITTREAVLERRNRLLWLLEAQQQPKIWKVIEAMNAANVRLPHGSTVLLLDDPFLWCLARVTQ